MVLVPDWAERARGGHLLRTDAVIAALGEAGGIGRVLGALRVMPASWRDPFYSGVARCRYAVFGQWEPRPLPRAEWTERFLP
jgi:predicted DCC family thiol-disulfide oxidoreductase YuxK